MLSYLRLFLFLRPLLSLPLFLLPIGLSTVSLLTACRPSNDGIASNESFVINGDTVILPKSHVISIKTELYQPSFGLQGVILPKQEQNLTAPFDGKIASLSVQQGTTLALGDIVLSIRPKLPPLSSPATDDNDNTVTYANDDKADSDKLDGKKLNSDKNTGNNSNQSSTDLDNHLNTNSNNDTVNNDIINDDTLNNHLTDNHLTDNHLTGNDLTDNTPQHRYGEQVAIVAPMAGTVDLLYTQIYNTVNKGDTLAHLSDDSEFYFISLLPKNYENYLTIGQTVNFTLSNPTIRLNKSSTETATSKQATQKQAIPNQDAQRFSGQVANISPSPNSRNGTEQIAVTVQILPNNLSNNTLSKGLQVGGRINYGSLTLGAVVPAVAIADGTSLLELQKPPYQPLTPLPANIWIIGQDGTLSLSPIDIIAYQPDTQRYLVSGISGDSLLVSANLPANADGKKVVLQ